MLRHRTILRRGAFGGGKKIGDFVKIPWFLRAEKGGTFLSGVLPFQNRTKSPGPWADGEGFEKHSAASRVLEVEIRTETAGGSPGDAKSPSHRRSPVLFLVSFVIIFVNLVLKNLNTKGTKADTKNTRKNTGGTALHEIDLP